MKDLAIFSIFGIAYSIIEIIWRGYTHPSMILVGGLCGLLIGLLNERNKKANIIKQMVMSMAIVTLFEFIFGCFLNLYLNLNVWDYSDMKFNILGQICPQFAIAWFFLSYAVIKLDDILRDFLGGDNK